MRVNVYAEEMTDRIEIIGKEIDGHTFTGLRFYLELPCTVPADPILSAGGHEPRMMTVRGPFIHQPGDDDSAAVTFWGKRDLREVLRKALAMLDGHYGSRTYRTNEGSPLSENVAFDDDRDIASVYGVRIAGELLRTLATPTPPGVWFRITRVEDGVSTIEQRNEETKA